MHKSDDKTNFTNYRPISILPCFSKSNPVKSDILKNLQYGFRSKHSTFMAIFELTNKKFEVLQSVSSLISRRQLPHSKIPSYILRSKIPSYYILRSKIPSYYILRSKIPSYILRSKIPSYYILFMVYEAFLCLGSKMILILGVNFLN